MKKAQNTSRIVTAALFMTAAVGLCVAEPTFIGAQKCKMCHKVEFASWETMAHAKAFEPLEEADRAKPECLTCHATGGSATMPGVQCESCHGAGSGYKSLTVMKDHAASVAAGLIVPDEATCKSCHEKAPHELKPFDYKTAAPKAMHAIKPKS